MVVVVATSWECVVSNDRIFELLTDSVPPAERPPFVATGRLTRETLVAAIESVREDTAIQVCVGGDWHVVHPAEWDRGGLARCANCFQMVDLGVR